MTGRGSRYAAIATVLSMAHAVALAADQEPVVRIGDLVVTAPQITAEFAYSPPALIHQVKRSDNAARLLAIEWYSNALIARAAQDDKIFEQMPGLEAAANTIRTKMIASRVLPHYVKQKFKADEAELRQFMDMNTELCRASARYRVARIVVVVGKKATDAEVQGAKGRIEEIKKRLATGESFAAVADERSDRTETAPGGELGWLSDEELERNEARDTIRGLSKDQVSEALATSEGLVVYKLLDRQEPRQLSFAECRETLDRVMNEKFQAQIARQWVDELAQRYHASMNVDAFAAAVRAVPIDQNWLEKQAAKDAMK